MSSEKEAAASSSQSGGGWSSSSMVRRCPVCGNRFKSHKSWLSHKRSKKHRSALQKALRSDPNLLDKHPLLGDEPSQAAEPPTSQAPPLAPRGPWAAEELSVLAKAVARFPGGTNDRWAQIHKMVEKRCGSPGVAPRTLKEVIAKARVAELSAKGYRPAASTGDAKCDADGWTRAQQAALESALREIKKGAGTGDRWAAIAARVGGKTRAECVARFKFIRQQIKAQKAASGAQVAPT